MNYEGLIEEINNLIETLAKETPESENYEAHVQRLGELQEILIKGEEIALKVKTQEADEALKRRELIVQEQDIHQRSISAKREVVMEYVKTGLLIVGTIAAECVTQMIEDRSLIPQKSWALLQGLLRRA